MVKYIGCFIDEDRKLRLGVPIKKRTEILLVDKFLMAMEKEISPKIIYTEDEIRLIEPNAKRGDRFYTKVGLIRIPIEVI